MKNSSGQFSSNSADPLARFGLGLAIIRDGALEEGRRYLEMAVGLDSSNSLLRSYLGKAYFEEKRDPLDAKQFEIAKQLDPLDPTPYLYDAIRLQSINRPVEAMLSMEKSIELNDNRAIYRSRELLNSDRATRGANLAQIYQDLGFEQLGLNQGYEFVALDPGNSSAHRFLSDAYIGVPRREIARVSELLQAQMLQDININPVQPSLAETNLSLLSRGGPFKASYNEYTPLFERNDLQLVGAGLEGNEDTHGFEGIASALYDRFSLSIGSFRYETDGWRENNTIDHRIQNVFVQAAVTPDFNLQAEYRHRESEHGDLTFNFDPNFFNPQVNNTLDQDTARFGVRYSPSPNNDVLVSLVYGNRDELATDFFPGFDLGNVQKSYQGEAQYIYKADRINLVSGFGYTNVEGGFEFPSLVPPVETPLEINHWHGYIYNNIKIPSSVTWTVGLAYDDFNQDFITSVIVDKISPKLGVRWDITPNLSLRGAVFRWIKPALAANRTLEPTQVAGFDQVYDDVNGDESWRRGVGLDWQVTKQLFAGAEATWRDLKVPFIVDSDTAVFEGWKERVHRAYISWAPTHRISLSGQLVYDSFEAESGFFTSSSLTPKRLKTFSVPLAARYFATNGLFAGIGVTFLDQDVARDPLALASNPGLSDGRDSFYVVDASVGWRLPKRVGIVSFTAYNLFNEKFSYQDDSFREFRDDPAPGQYFPDRRLVARGTLYF